MEHQQFRADLHMHSDCSDGKNTPKELVDMAKNLGLSGISITDHDTVAAYTDELIAYARQQSIELLTGVEFSSRDGDVPVHILGYGVDPLCDSVLEFSLRHIERRSKRNREILERLRGKGIHIDPERLLQEGKQVIGRPHIASLLVEAGVVGSIQAAFDKYLGDKKPCFVMGKPFGVEETIEAIRASGGKAFLAHPHLMKSKKLVNKLLSEYDFDGLEVYYAKFPPPQEKEWLDLAEENGLLISGGSDFHGDIKPMNPLGCSWVDYDTFQTIAN